MSSFKDHFMVMDNAKAQQDAIDEFVRLIDAGEHVPRYIMEFMANLHAGRIETKQGRPATAHRDFRLFAAWYAAYCDPDFNTIPKSKGRRFAAVGELLCCSQRQAERRAKAFESLRGTDILLAQLFHGEKYYRLKKKDWNDTAEDEMTRNMRAYL